MECKQHLQLLQNMYAILSTHWLMCSIKKREREKEKECHGPCASPADPTLGDMFCFLLPLSFSSAGAVLITWPKPLCSVTTPAPDPQCSWVLLKTAVLRYSSLDRWAICIFPWSVPANLKTPQTSVWKREWLQRRVGSGGEWGVCVCGGGGGHCLRARGRV